MATTTLTITKIDYGNTASGTQTFTFWYKLSTDAGWTLISNSVSVNTDGTLGAPIVLTVNTGSVYFVQAGPNCESPVDYFTQQIQT